MAPLACSRCSFRSRRPKRSRRIDGNTAALLATHRIGSDHLSCCMPIAHRPGSRQQPLHADDVVADMPAQPNVADRMDRDAVEPETVVPRIRAIDTEHSPVVVSISVKSAVVYRSDGEGSSAKDDRAEQPSRTEVIDRNRRSIAVAALALGSSALSDRRSPKPCYRRKSPPKDDFSRRHMKARGACPTLGLRRTSPVSATADHFLSTCTGTISGVTWSRLEIGGVSRQPTQTCPSMSTVVRDNCGNGRPPH